MFPEDDAPIIAVNANRIPEAPASLDHRGLFGMKGTLRDVIGVLGDAFLTQAGRAPVYMPQRQQELDADALQGYFDGNEVEREAALSRFGQRDPLAAAKLKQSDDTREMTKAYRESALASRDIGNEIRKEALRRQKTEAYYKYAGGLVNGANPETWPTIRNRLRKLGERFEITDEEIPEEFDPDWVGTFGQMGMTGYQATRADQIGRDTDSKITNRRPPQPKNAPRPVPIMRDGKRVWVRPEEAYNQEAPPPGKDKGGLSVPPWFKDNGDGTYTNTRTGKILKPKAK